MRARKLAWNALYNINIFCAPPLMNGSCSCYQNTIDLDDHYELRDLMAKKDKGFWAVRGKKSDDFWAVRGKKNDDFWAVRGKRSTNADHKVLF